MRMHQESILNLIREHTPNPQRGAEIGCWMGETSALLLRELKTCHMTCVDTWKAWDEGTSYHDGHATMGRLTQDEWDDIYREAIRTIKATGGQFTICNMTSKSATLGVPNESLDFVFLDASHVYADVKQDIEVWLPKVKVGGLVIGHDYGALLDKRGVWGVSRAVHEIFGQENVIVRKGLIWAVKKTECAE